MKINGDICRCLDDECEKNTTCLRYLGKDDYHPRLSFVATMRDSRGLAGCRYYMPASFDKEENNKEKQ